MKKIDLISIIDDDPITIFGIKKMLDSLEISNEINTYLNGKIAIDAIREGIEQGERIPEVIFLDINMPIMDGWQFLDEFLELPIRDCIRINIVTSSIDPLDRQNWEHYKGLTHHQIDFRNKPICKEDIVQMTSAA